MESSELVVHDDAAVPGDLAQHLAGHLLPHADRLKFGQALRLQQQRESLLVLGAPDLEHRHRLVAER